MKTGIPKAHWVKAILGADLLSMSGKIKPANWTQTFLEIVIIIVIGKVFLKAL